MQLVALLILLSTYSITLTGSTSWRNNDYAAWIDWSDNSPIFGETNESLTATPNGDYAVEISDANNCSYSSSCLTINAIGIQEFINSDGTALYPNPTSGENTIEFGEIHSDLNLEVTNNLRQIISWEQLTNIKQIKTALNVAPGVSFIPLKLARDEFVSPLIKH